nr:sodium-dependent nutrient amino acid transporter 1-like [Dermacentor andersoni]
MVHRSQIPCETVATVLARRYSGSGVRDGYPLLYRGRVTIVPIDDFNNASANCVPGTESAVTGFYDKVILGLGSGVSDLLGLRMDTVFISAAVFIVLFLLLSDGLPKMQYSLYALAVSQYTLLAALLGATVVRDGAFVGLSQLPVWKFGALARLSLWQDVVAFAAFGIGLGGYGISFITAHNSFQNNFVVDLAYLLVLDTLKCLGTAAIVFFVLGSYARKTGLEIDQVMASNVVEDVAFAQIPQALLSTQTNGVVLPVFFLFVVFMGLGSLLLTTELVLEVVDEEFPHAHVNNRTVRVVTSVICFFASCVYTTPAGPYIKVLVLEYLYYVVGFANIIGELLVVFQLYGLERVMIDCDLMLERTPWRVLQVLWTSVIPMVLTEYWPWKEQETSREISSGHGTIPLIGMQLLKRTACGPEESFLTSSTLNSIALRRRFCGQWPTSSLKAACGLWPAEGIRTTCTSCAETDVLRSLGARAALRRCPWAQAVSTGLPSCTS